MVARSETRMLGRDSACFQFVQLFDQTLQVDHHAGTENVDDVGIEYPRGKQVEFKFPVLIHHGMARIVTPLETHDIVSVLRQVIHHTAFAFITPICAYNDFYAHVQPSFPLVLYALMHILSTCVLGKGIAIANPHEYTSTKGCNMAYTLKG